MPGLSPILQVFENNQYAYLLQRCAQVEFTAFACVECLDASVAIQQKTRTLDATKSAIILSSGITSVSLSHMGRSPWVNLGARRLRVEISSRSHFQGFSSY